MSDHEPPSSPLAADGQATPQDASGLEATLRTPSNPQTPANGLAGGASPWSPSRLPVVDRDSYAIWGEMAHGGIGRILRARDLRLDRPVAVKELLDPGGAVEGRFVAEALVTARLQHPSIVPIYEAGRWPTGEPFYSMKLVSGRSFAEVIAEAKTLDQRLALLPHALAVAEAVAYAHSERIIHRDLKPANILVGSFGETVLIDWGLAKDLSAAEGAPAPADEATPQADGNGNLTLAGAVIGTPTWQPVPH